MKTTIDIAEPLLRDARTYATAHGLTLHVVVELGLRAVLPPPERTIPYKLRDASFTGDRLNPAFQAMPWNDVRDTIYGQDRD